MYHMTFYDKRFPFYEVTLTSKMAAVWPLTCKRTVWGKTDLDSAPSVWVRNNKIKLPPDLKNENALLRGLAHGLIGGTTRRGWCWTRRAHLSSLNYIWAARGCLCPLSVYRPGNSPFRGSLQMPAYWKKDFFSHNCTRRIPFWWKKNMVFIRKNLWKNEFLCLWPSSHRSR